MTQPTSGRPSEADWNKVWEGLSAPEFADIRQKLSFDICRRLFRHFESVASLTAERELAEERRQLAGAKSREESWNKIAYEQEARADNAERETLELAESACEVIRANHKFLERNVSGTGGINAKWQEEQAHLNQALGAAECIKAIRAITPSAPVESSDPIGDTQYADAVAKFGHGWERRKGERRWASLWAIHYHANTGKKNRRVHIDRRTSGESAREEQGRSALRRAIGMTDQRESADCGHVGSSNNPSVSRQSDPHPQRPSPGSGGGERPCNCGQRIIPAGFDGMSWYWQLHKADICTLELPNIRCWCGLLRHEHITGHARERCQDEDHQNAAPQVGTQECEGVAQCPAEPAGAASTKPLECANGCPPFQVCDYCQGTRGKDAPDSAEGLLRECREYIALAEAGIAVKARTRIFRDIDDCLAHLRREPR